MFLGQRGQRVAGPHLDAFRLVIGASLDSRDRQGPARLQHIRATGQLAGVGPRDLAPGKAVPVVLLGQAPQVVTLFDDVGVILRPLLSCGAAVAHRVCPNRVRRDVGAVHRGDRRVGRLIGR